MITTDELYEIIEFLYPGKYTKIPGAGNSFWGEDGEIYSIHYYKKKSTTKHILIDGTTIRNQGDFIDKLYLPENFNGRFYCVPGFPLAFIHPDRFIFILKISRTEKKVDKNGGQYLYINGVRNTFVMSYELIKKKVQEAKDFKDAVPVTNFPGYLVTPDGTVIGKGGIRLTVQGRRNNVQLRRDNEIYDVKIARLVATEFVSNISGYRYIKYKDGNRNNFHYTNLEWISDKEFQIYRGRCYREINSYTAEEAFSLCQCDVLKRFYKTRDRSEIDAMIVSLYRGNDEFHNDCVSDVYVTLTERLDRNSIIKPIMPYLLSCISFLYKKNRNAKKDTSKKHINRDFQSWDVEETDLFYGVEE